VRSPRSGDETAKASPRSHSGEAAARAAVIFLAVVVAGALVRVFRELLSPLVVALFLLCLIDQVARGLQRRLPQIPGSLRGAFAAASILATFAAVSFLLVFQGPAFAHELADVEPHVDELLAQVARLLDQPPITVHDLFRGEGPSRTLARVFGAARIGIAWVGWVLIYLGFLIAARSAFSAKLERLYRSQGGRAQGERIFQRVRNAVELYGRLVSLKALLFAIVAFFVMEAAGVKPALLIAFFVFLAAFVPIIGAFVGAILPAFVALAQFSDLTRPLTVGVALGIAAFLIDNVLMPKLQGDELNIDPLIVLISIGFWALILGPPGILLATPLSVAVMAVAAEFEGTRWLAILISRDGEPGPFS
jgi:AI-2 transport protein TqsA